MEEIKANEYVRIKGYIGTVENINDFREPSMKYAIEIPKANDLVFVGEQDIENHSFNIIDLIEVGDYVNGHLVIDTDNINTGVMREIYCEDNEDFGLWNEHINTIVTKEQFTNIEYRIGENNE